MANRVKQCFLMGLASALLVGSYAYGDCCSSSCCKTATTFAFSTGGMCAKYSNPTCQFLDVDLKKSYYSGNRLIR